MTMLLCGPFRWQNLPMFRPPGESTWIAAHLLYQRKHSTDEWLAPDCGQQFGLATVSSRDYPLEDKWPYICIPSSRSMVNKAHSNWGMFKCVPNVTWLCQGISHIQTAMGCTACPWFRALGSQVAGVATATDLRRRGWSIAELLGRRVTLVPSGNFTVCYWKLPFIVDKPIENCDFP